MIWAAGSHGWRETKSFLWPSAPILLLPVNIWDLLISLVSLNPKVQRWRGGSRIGHARSHNDQLRKDKERLDWHLLSQSSPFSLSFSGNTCVTPPHSTIQSLRVSHVSVSTSFSSLHFSLFFSIFFPPSSLPLCHIHLYQAKAGFASACLPAWLPGSPERCRSAACSDSPEEHPGCSPPRCHSERLEGNEVGGREGDKERQRNREGGGRGEWLKRQGGKAYEQMLNTDVCLSQNKCQIRFGGWSTSPRTEEDVNMCLHLLTNLKD